MCYRANTPVLICGPTGIGKTEAIIAAAAELSIAYQVIDLPIMEPVDLLGLPEKNGVTVTYLPPAFLPRSGSGIFFMDELNRAAQAMQNASLRILSARELNQYKLPPGWLPCAAINPDDDERYNTNRLDDAMFARFVMIDVSSNVPDWLKWGEKNHVHEAVLAFVRATPDIFDGRFSNPRSWTRVSKLIDEYAGGRFKEETLHAVIEGCVGVVLATAFIRTLRNKKLTQLPTAEEIVFKYRKVRSVIQTNVASGNTANLTSMCHCVAMLLQAPGHEKQVKQDKTAIANIRQFYADLPAEFKKMLFSFVPWIKTGEQV